MADPQKTDRHDAVMHVETTPAYSKYVDGHIQTLADQAANGGWLPHAGPLFGDTPQLQTMGSADDNKGGDS